ncbi:hypothetical protein NQ317_017730 [Molorchus minor]|uniref:C2H2-type domain-containing protein n=1 Tax=Molorchus minor TaxID=1323400 RepID=A0ABQ9IX80_9CUCU|nr:hypothetical protein NQ317_017730 [Molorchus minor]
MKKANFKRNFAVSENPVICRNCADLAWKAFTFKSKCISTEEIILSHAVAKDVTSLDMKWIYCTEMACEVTENNNVCRFCMACVGEGNYLCLENNKCWPRNKLEQFLPEIEFNIVEPVACLPCVELLVNYFKLASTSASVEEIINEYCQQEGTNSNGFVNFNDVVKFSRGEAARCGVTFNERVVKETLSSGDDSDFKEINIKIEVHDLKDEVGIDLPIKSEHFAEDSKPANLENGKITQAVCSDLCYECPLCKFKTETKADLRSHVGIHIVEPNAESIGDVACTDKSDNQSYLKRHVAFHDKSIVVETYESGTCDFTAKCKAIFKNHSLSVPSVAQQKMIVRRGISKVKMYECETCHFKTKHKGSLINHRLVHRKHCEVQMYECETCKYKTKRKGNLKIHSLVHKENSEVKMYECETCKYKTKHKGNLKQHILVHRENSEVEMYECETCHFKTKRKGHLQQHLLVHRKNSEVDMYECESCLFKTKHKDSLITHNLVHRDISEVKMYECETCKYKTKYKGNFKQHLLVHKENSEVKMYEFERVILRQNIKAVLKNIPLFIKQIVK